MIRLHFVVEGQTEEGFVNQLLRDHLANCGVFADARSVETSRDRHRIHRGGVLDFGRVRRDLERWMKEERHHAEAHFTTMLDLYALPDDFPGYAEARRSGNPYRRVRDLEGALKAELGHDRLIPYIQLHEFEALLFADPARLGHRFPEHRDGIQRLVALAAEFEGPEHIDDDAPPSKRIAAEVPDYAGAKASAGPLVAGHIGLPTLRARCPHFGEWLSRLEALGSPLIAP